MESPVYKNTLKSIIICVKLCSDLLVILSMVGVFLLPKVKVQTELFMSQFPSYLERVDKEILN